MTKKSDDPFDPFFNARKLVEQARRLSADKRAAFEARMAEARARTVDLRAFHMRRAAEIAALAAERRDGRPRPPKPSGKPRPRRDEGGEPMPAVPRPRPKPLAGGAAAPLDPDRRAPAGGDARKRTRRVRSPSDAESRQSL